VNLLRTIFLVAIGVVVTACATPDIPPADGERAMTADEGRALVAALLPPRVADRHGWAIDIYAAIGAIGVRASPENVCAAIAVIEQESSFQTDPVVPGLGKIAIDEIERRREAAGVPKLILDAALALASADGRSYRERIVAARTERELSELYDAWIDAMPLARPFLADNNPVRTGGPMQVGIAFAEAYAEAKPYPYPVDKSIRREVFTRRGGVYFGIAHLLDYTAPYERPLYRFADFNAGRYASRNAAFQQAITQITGIPLAQDGDLLRYAGDRAAREPSQTELATRVLATRLRMSDDEIRRDLELARGTRFERSELYAKVMKLAADASGAPVPRAVVPRIPLRSPKLRRPLTTDWFAHRVDERYGACLARGRNGGNRRR
jgi:hypothetical protein